MRALMAMAWRNVLRNPRRSMLTAVAMGIGVCLCMNMLALTDGMYAQMRDILVTRTLGHVQIHHPDYPGVRSLHDTLPDLPALTAQLDALPSVAGVSVRLYGNGLVGGADTTTGAMLVGIDPRREADMRRLDTKIRQGRYLPETPEGGILIGVDLADKLEVELGESIVVVTQAADGSLGNELYEVLGTFAVGSPMLDRGGAFLHINDLAELLVLPDQAHELTLVGHDDDDASIAAMRAEAVAALADDEVVVRTWDEVDPASAAMFGMQAASNFVLTFIFLGIAAIGVVNTLLMSVMERTREFGVMRALGVRPGELIQLVVMESLVIAVFATLAGVTLGALGDIWLVTQGLDLRVQGVAYTMGNMTFEPIIYGEVNATNVLVPVVGVFICSVLASLWPAWRAARLRPVDALRGAE